MASVPPRPRGWRACCLAVCPPAEGLGGKWTFQTHTKAPQSHTQPERLIRRILRVSACLFQALTVPPPVFCRRGRDKHAYVTSPNVFTSRVSNQSFNRRKEHQQQQQHNKKQEEQTVSLGAQHSGRQSVCPQGRRASLRSHLQRDAAPPRRARAAVRP